MNKLISPSQKSIQRVLLICNGEQPTRTLARRLARAAGCIVAADGGANGARTLGLTPDLIIGDLDSITLETRRFFSTTPVVRVSRQDNTDLEKALDHIVAASLGQEVMIIGAIGRRIDHTLGNLATLSRYQDRLRVLACGDDWYAVPVKNIETIHASIGTTVSLIPFGNCNGVTLRGLKFPLRNASIPASHVAVSNVVERSPCTISLRRGKLLAIVLEEFVPR